MPLSETPQRKCTPLARRVLGNTDVKGTEKMVMSSEQTATEVFDQVFLQVRAKLIEIAASLDRIERGESAEVLADDARLKRIGEGIKILGSTGFDKAERIQSVFSDEYDPNWNQTSS